MKTCRKCLATKSIEAFYVHRMMADGHLNFCKECVKERMREQAKRPEAIERERNRGRKFNQERMKKYVNPVVRRAQARVRTAICGGRLVRPDTCESCGAVGGPIEAAHRDYSEPLDVRWLCRGCHRRWDFAEPKTAVYRTESF